MTSGTEQENKLAYSEEKECPKLRPLIEMHLRGIILSRKASHRINMV